MGRRKKQQQRRPPTRQLPAWYYRVLRLVLDKDRDPYPAEFDEDISDFEEKSENKKIKQYEDEELEDEADESNDSLDEYESDRSYDGSDADCYYELRELREDQKHELVKIREEEEKSINNEKLIVEKVKAAERSHHAALDNGQRPSPLSIAHKHFNLHSTHYAESFPLRDSSRYVEFYYLTEDDWGGEKASPALGEDLLFGHIYLNEKKSCGFEPSTAPEQTDLQDIGLKSHGERKKYEFTLKVIDSDHLLLYVPRDYIFVGESERKSVSAPEIFEFVGVRFDYEKARQERLERLEKERKRKRSSSPVRHFL